MIQSLTSETVQRYVRYAIYMLVGYLAQRGLTVDNQLVDIAVPVALGLANVAWSVYGNRINARIAEVAKYAADPSTPVRGVVMAPTAEGRALARSSPAGAEVAGSIAAAKIAMVPDGLIPAGPRPEQVPRQG